MSRVDSHYSNIIDFDHYARLDDCYVTLIKELSDTIVDWRNNGYRELTIFYSPYLSYNSFDKELYQKMTIIDTLRKGEFPYTKFDIHFLANSLNEYQFASVSLTSQFMGDDYLTNINPTVITNIDDTRTNNSLYTALLNFINHVLENANRYMKATEYLLEDSAMVIDIITNSYNINPFVNEEKYIEQYALDVKSLLERAKNI